MQDWDRLVLLIVSLPLVIHQGYVGWQSWRKSAYDAVVGAFLLAVLCVALPITLAMMTG